MARSNTATRRRPVPFAAYIARSACCTSSDALMPLPPIAMPMLIDTMCSRPSITIGWRTTSMKRCAIAVAPSAVELLATHDDELVTTESADEVVGPGRVDQSGGHRRQERVTHAVAEAVVHELESVEVTEQHRHRIARSKRFRQRLEEHLSIGETW